jgi:hypothetical protein
MSRLSRTLMICTTVVVLTGVVALIGPTLTTPAQADDDGTNYVLDTDWPNYPADMQFEMGSGVAVDADGIVYLFTRDIEHWAAHPLAMKQKMGKSSVSMFDSTGKYLGKWGPSDDRGFALGAHTMYIDQEGKFWFLTAMAMRSSAMSPMGR